MLYSYVEGGAPLLVSHIYVCAALLEDGQTAAVTVDCSKVDWEELPDLILDVRIGSPLQQQPRDLVRALLSRNVQRGFLSVPKGRLTWLMPTVVSSSVAMISALPP